MNIEYLLPNIAEMLILLDKTCISKKFELSVLETIEKFSMNNNDTTPSKIAASFIDKLNLNLLEDCMLLSLLPEDVKKNLESK